MGEGIIDIRKYLGEDEERARSVKEDILFLSGECAGPLSFRDLAHLED
jgi:hypothetical protein